MDSKAHWVAFRISDVFLPGAAELLLGLQADTVIMGKVVGYSDSGSQANVFCVVELGEKRVIVARDKLLGLEIRPNSGAKVKE